MASPSMFDEEHDEVLFEEHSTSITATLNRPTKLNSLTFVMIAQILRTLREKENDSSLNVAILKGQGRGFSAGGDVARIISYSTAGHWSFAMSFYRKQLTLDHLLGTYKKPVVSLINGIVMGGGAGLSMHGKFRVVTERAMFAMPETSLGLMPDVGASHFLTRLPGFFGEYLGLTGARINGNEMAACGLATHFVLSKDINLLEKALREVASSDPTTISKIIDKFAQKPSIKQGSAWNRTRLDVINFCFSKNTVEEIILSLENEVAKGGDKLFVDALKSMKKASPTSLKVSLRSIREGRNQTLEQCFVREYIICCNMVRKTVNRDFYEGVRAIIFEKDKNPKWEPSKLELVTNEMVDQHFIEPDDDDWVSIQLPDRSNPTKTAKPKL